MEPLTGKIVRRPGRMQSLVSGRPLGSARIEGSLGRVSSDASLAARESGQRTIRSGQVAGLRSHTVRFKKATWGVG
jgi:hypothetical protein